MLRKIDLMHKMFGVVETKKCKDCQHFKKYRYHDYNYQKCEVYGITQSASSDWIGKNMACGLFPDKPYEGDREVIRITEKKPRIEEQIEGQLSLFQI